MFLFTDLLRGRSAAVGQINGKFPAVVSNNSKEMAQSLNKIRALDLGTDGSFPGYPKYRSPWVTSTLPDPLLELQELSFGRFGKTEHLVPWVAILDAIPWARLRRLRIQGVLLERRLQDVIAKLRDLEEMCLEAVGPDTFHANCPFKRPVIHSDVNYPFFAIDFTSVPKLHALEVVGICNHVPIRNLVGSGLRALKLHKPDGRCSVVSDESQRSSSDLAMIGKLAPCLERLELDIGYVENLWHPTAIPGVEVDMEQYHFLSALSNIKELRTLRLFPPYVAREDFHSDFCSHTGLCQPLPDEQAVRICNYLRGHCRKLEVLYVSVSAMTVTLEMDFFPMNWEVRVWGDKTLVTTRQLGKNYELRQVWVGERRLTLETKKHAYWKKHIPDSENWLLSRSC
jgi:hypothetical protein